MYHTLASPNVGDKSYKYPDHKMLRIYIWALSLFVVFSLTEWNAEPDKSIQLCWSAAIKHYTAFMSIY